MLRLLTLLCFLTLILFNFKTNSSRVISQSNDDIIVQLVAEYQLDFIQDAYWFNHDGTMLGINLGDVIEFVDMQTLETLEILELVLRDAPNGADTQREIVTSAGFVSNDYFVVGTSVGSPFRDFGQLFLWNTIENSDLEILENRASIDNIAISFTGDYLSYTRQIDEVILENIFTREILYTTQVDGRFGGSPIFSPTENLLAVILSGFNIQLVDLESNIINNLILSYVPYDLSFSPLGNLLASHNDDYLDLWDVGTLETIRHFDFSTGEFIADTDINMSENLIAIAGSQLRPDVNLLVMDFETNEEILASDIYNDSVFTVAFHPSMPILASGGRDGYIRLWNIEESDNPIFEFEMDRAIINLAFSPDGNYLLAQTMTELFIWGVEN